VVNEGKRGVRISTYRTVLVSSAKRLAFIELTDEWAQVAAAR
jgi:hypothetical protein